MHTSSVHIAGIGISARIDASSDELAVSAATKAFLDAGVVFSEVDQGIVGFVDRELRVSRECFGVFGKEGAPIIEVDDHSGLFVAAQCTASRQRNCVLVVGIDQAASSSEGQTQVVAIAAVLVSKLFLTSHAYLKDGAVCIRATSLRSRPSFLSSIKHQAHGQRSIEIAVQIALRQAGLVAKDPQIVEAQSVQQVLRAVDPLQPQRSPDASSLHTGTTGYAALCELVWRLRGWSQDGPPGEVRNCLQCTISENGAIGVVILCRSDGRAAPAWSELKDVRDGRERLGYNHAVEKRGIALEDLEAVRSRRVSLSAALTKALRLPVKGGDRAALARL
ncbi:hypothetical protein LTR22_021115 [Elasticomyces elasticus]|nr:hypothetical protein LTR22_021115 [Elasticomyces elasticus]KAK4925370.1 hypothetical protein LTR49_007668 [Elasticomyces elasticus]